jgi:hypothetical protein
MPVAPRESIDTFCRETDPQKEPPVAPIPGAADPPTTFSVPLSIERKVMFDPDEHPIPALSADVDEIVFVPVTKIVTELSEITKGEAPWRLISETFRMISASLIRTECDDDLPITLIVGLTELGSSAPHATCCSETVILPDEMSHSMIEESVVIQSRSTNQVK